MSGSELTADEVISILGLAPHPEGGAFRETFRDPRPIDAAGRGASTAIYFLLRQGEVSRWHRVDAAELWHWHAGAALALHIVADGQPETVQRLGCDLRAGERPQGLVPAGAWQQARSLGAWSLVGCTVAPAFEFARFELAPPGFAPQGSG